MLLDSAVAQRAATWIRRLAPLGLALAIIAPGSLASPQPAAAAGPKVVIVVGPTHSATARLLAQARSYAGTARALGANVVEVYTPQATWARVRSAAQGAKVLIYLGHGNGWPSPYAANPVTKNGFGLNPPTGAGTTQPVKYYGEGTVAAEVRLAPGATVMLNHLCYASGNSEPGQAEPTWSVAHQRVDNYAAGFIAAGAGAVLADGHSGVEWELKVLLGPNRNLLAAWRGDRDANGHERAIPSARRPGYTNYMDPDGAASGFYRALTTTPGFTTSGGTAAPAPAAPAPAVAPSPLRATTGTTATLRTGPSASRRAVVTLRAGTKLTVTGLFRNDSRGRTWAPVRTQSGKKGFVAAWLIKVMGSAVAVDNVALRNTARVRGTHLATIPAGTRVAVLGSGRDSRNGVWLKVVTPSGQVGWMAAWFMRP